MPPLKVDRPLEPSNYLRALPYADYRNSAWWKSRRAAFVDASGVTPTCYICGTKKGSIRSRDGSTFCPHLPYFHVHHLSYENLGDEQDIDLVLLCSACHGLIEHDLRARDGGWRETPSADYWRSYLEVFGGRERWERFGMVLDATLREPAYKRRIRARAEIEAFAQERGDEERAAFEELLDYVLAERWKAESDGDHEESRFHAGAYEILVEADFKRSCGHSRYCEYLDWAEAREEARRARSNG